MMATDTATWDWLALQWPMERALALQEMLRARRFQAECRAFMGWRRMLEDIRQEMRLGMDIANRANRVLSALRTRAFSAWAAQSAHTRALSFLFSAVQARLRTGKIRARFHEWRVAAVGREAGRVGALLDAGERRAERALATVSRDFSTF
ncbi:hypothetical protein T484DRAFT_1887312 [Baffinella frigidus]|nr:hypothetical protein T484DRAFT_1887312 [Cryptophyta sp. CCMP2293]